MIDMILALLSGGMLILAFPKPDLFYLAYFALVPLLISIKRSKNMFDAALNGLLCGIVFFGGTLYWINVLSRWAGVWVSLAWFSLSVLQAMFIVVFACSLRICLDRYPRYSLAITPLLWVIIEWVRSLGPYGVTGGGLGYSQAEFLPILQIASIATVYGISFLVVYINASLAEALTGKKLGQLGIAAVIFVTALSFGHYRINTFKPSGRPVNIAVIQANIAQDVKLDFGLAYQIVDIHEAMSRKALESGPDIIIWPETAVTTYLFESRSILNSVRSLVKDSRTYYLIGTPFREGGKIYNSVAAFSRNGEFLGRYDKQRLVPFGEYLPLRQIFFRLLQENPLFSEDYNSNPNPRIIDLGGIKAGVVICFESTLPYIVRDKVRKGAQFMLVVTNDAWFFDTAALYQHLQAARLRAVENNIYFVQAANTGISAIIDPLGRVVKRSLVEEAVVLTGTVYIH